MVAQPNYGLSTDTTLGGNSPSDIISPSQKAIKTYVDAQGGGGASALSDLTDVSLSSLASGEVLGYDGTDWVNVSRTLVTIRDWSIS